MIGHQVPVDVGVSGGDRPDLRIEKGLQKAIRFVAPAVLAELRIRVLQGDALLGSGEVVAVWGPAQ